MHTTNNQDIKAARNQYCPVTGLPIHRKPEWTDVAFGNKFSMTYSILGDGILFCKAYGYATLQDARNASRFAYKLAADAFPGVCSYVQVEDYSDFQGGSIEARRYLLNVISKNKRLVGLIFFGAAPVSRMSINLANRANIFKFDLKIAENYKHAIELALEMLSTDEKPHDEIRGPIAPIRSLSPERESCHITGLPVTARPEWAGIRMGNAGRATFKFIGDRILLSTICGKLDRRYMEGFFRKRRMVLEAMLGPDKPFFELVDLSGAKTRCPRFPIENPGQRNNS